MKRIIVLTAIGAISVALFLTVLLSILCIIGYIFQLIISSGYIDFLKNTILIIMFLVFCYGIGFLIDLIRQDLRKNKNLLNKQN